MADIHHVLEGHIAPWSPSDRSVIPDNSNIIAALVPTYLKEVPRDPVASRRYSFFIRGWVKKNGERNLQRHV